MSALRAVSSVVLAVLGALLIVICTVWGTLALYYRVPLSGSWRLLPAALFALLGLAALLGLCLHSLRRPTVLSFVVAFALLLVWWGTIKARNDRDWQTDVAVQPYADINGNLVTVHNIRNFVYRSETDYTPRYYDKTFDLDRLDTVDLIASYWMGDAIAHIFVSFGFSGQDYLAISIETRKERGESYSTLAGFFKEYELYYVVADERDVIGLRTNYRQSPPEDVYLFRTNAPPENVRRLFLDYIQSMNSLREDPEFYNTLTTNCTTSIWMHTKVNQQSLPINWKLIASGYVPQLAYEYGRLDTRLPFEELRRRGHINEAAHAAGDAADFSQRIRANVPAPLPVGAK